MNARLVRFVSCAACLLGFSVAASGQALSLENVVDPGPNRPDEPVARAFSPRRAVEFLDAASLTWQKNRKCFTCHTNYAYLYARPLADPRAPAHLTIRRAAEELVTDRWPTRGPRWPAEVVGTAAALAFNDAVTTGKLHATTRAALDRMWKVQRDDGAWEWLKCELPPLEYEDHYGACLAALAVAMAPDDYKNSETAQAGIAKLRRYLKDNSAPTLHHRAVLLWASSRWGDLLPRAEQQEIVKALLAKQNDDGGWALSTLGDWEREDGTAQDRGSDGYGTGFRVYILRQAGLPASDERLRRAVHWLKTHQRESGRWFTRSLTRDNKHFITHCGSAFAVMALASCNELGDVSGD